MRRLVVNPGTPQAWEIALKAGANLLGRGAHNDFQIDHPSVSGSHCEVIASDDSVWIKDLGSTNGTFVENAPVQEVQLQEGQTIRLGNVALAYYCGEGNPAEVVGAIPPAIPPASIRLHSTPPRIAGDGSPPVPDTGRRFCKFHPKSPARYLCTKCNRTFCELCVASRNVGGAVRKTCRTCGVECQPVAGQLAPPAPPKGFFARLPGVIIYPFRGSGVLVLIVATLVIAGLQFISRGWIALFTKVIALGYLFSYMQAIIHSTAAGDEEMPSLPEMDELFGAFFRLAATVLVSFCLPLGLLVARFSNTDVPISAIIATGVLGSLYFPMAFLAVAMKDTALSANPLIVVPAILKVPFQYLVTAVLFASIFGITQLGNVITSVVGLASLTTRSWSVLLMSFGLRAGWSFVSVYLLTVNMRILGLLYVANKDKLGWFTH
jgi:pSer/pThr/pTyr-binding forkhead associated (FHA) protein